MLTNWQCGVRVRVPLGSTLIKQPEPACDPLVALRAGRGVRVARLGHHAAMGLGEDATRTFSGGSGGVRQYGTMRILVVEDEAQLAEGLRAGLVADGFAVDVAAMAPTDCGWPVRSLSTPSCST